MTDSEKADDAVTAIMDTLTDVTEELEALKGKLDLLCEQVHDSCQEVAQLDYGLRPIEVPVGADVKILDGAPWIELEDCRVRLGENVTVTTKDGHVGFRVRGTHLLEGPVGLAAESGSVYLMIGGIVADRVAIE